MIGRNSTIRGLRSFCLAAKHESFKLAARELCVTPSAVSHQIKDLEEQLGQPLFKRETRKVELTDFGTTLAANVAPILEQLDDVLSKFIDRSRMHRTLRITLPQFFASELFLPMLRTFTDQHAGLEIRVDTTPMSYQHRAASDASVLLSASEPTGLAAYELFRLHLVPACSQKLAQAHGLQSEASLADETLIVHESRPTAWKDWFAQAQIACVQSKVIYLDSMFAVARAAERGLGVALVPERLSRPWFESGALTQLSKRELLTADSYYFVHRQEDETNADLCALRDWIVATFSSA